MGTIIKKIATTLLALIASMVILSVVLVISIVVGVGLLMPSEEISVKRGSLLELNLSTQIVEKSELTPLNGLLTALGEMPQTTSLFSLLRAIECAAEDPNITALSLRMDGSYNLPLATASELREALLDFRRVSSKPIYSYSEGYSQSGYYLASIADSVFINPLGSITWQGVSVDGIFYGDLLKNVGVKAEVFRPEGCDYKSAIEPYTSSKMSSESREQNGRIVDDIWGNIVGEVSRARGINIGTLYRMASDRIIIEPEEALREGMVSAIAYRDQYDRAIERLGVVRDRERDGEPLRTISSARYANRIDLLIEEDDSTRGENSEKIAIIYADGVIVDGDIPSSRGDEVVSGVISKQLRKARSDESVKAVILRVNSPGGSALAAEVIWREVELLRGEKPVIVSIGSYGASGGYYISAPADMIFVDRFSIGGSIGVYGIMFDGEQALREHLHITFDGVGSSPSANFGYLPRALSAAERGAMMRGVNSVYSRFKGHVGEGRHLTSSQVDALSGGRVWCGEEMLKNGLADGEGGLRKAIQIARERSGVGSDPQIVEYSAFDNSWGTLFSGGVFSKVLAANKGLLFKGITQINNDLSRLLENQNKVVMKSAERLNF